MNYISRLLTWGDAVLDARGNAVHSETAEKLERLIRYEGGADEIQKELDKPEQKAEKTQ